MASAGRRRWLARNELRGQGGLKGQRRFGLLSRFFPQRMCLCMTSSAIQAHDQVSSGNEGIR